MTPDQFARQRKKRGYRYRESRDQKKDPKIRYERNPESINNQIEFLKSEVVSEVRPHCVYRSQEQAAKFDRCYIAAMQCPPTWWMLRLNWSIGQWLEDFGLISAQKIYHDRRLSRILSKREEGK